MKRNNKGISLIELIVVIAIMAVLVGIIAPQFLGYVERTNEAKLKYNTRGLMEIVNLYSIEYPKNKWYGNSLMYYDNSFHNGATYDDMTLNNRIEYELEHIDDGHYFNDTNLINPYSDSMVILEYTSILSQGKKPAVFITKTKGYEYTGDKSTDELIGSIIVFFDVEADGNTDHIEFFYIKKDGSKSEYYEEL